MKDRSTLHVPRQVSRYSLNRSKKIMTMTIYQMPSCRQLWMRMILLSGHPCLLTRRGGDDTVTMLNKYVSPAVA